MAWILIYDSHGDQHFGRQGKTSWINEKPLVQRAVISFLNARCQEEILQYYADHGMTSYYICGNMSELRLAGREKQDSFTVQLALQTGREGIQAEYHMYPDNVNKWGIATSKSRLNAGSGTGLVVLWSR